MWVLPLTEYEVRGRMQVVFLWRASNDFGSQLSTLTGPESYGGLGTTSSTSPHAIFSHMDKFSLQMENSPGSQLSYEHLLCVCVSKHGTTLISQHWEPGHCSFLVTKVTPPLTVQSPWLSYKCCPPVQLIGLMRFQIPQQAAGLREVSARCPPEAQC